MTEPLVDALQRWGPLGVVVVVGAALLLRGSISFRYPRGDTDDERDGIPHKRKGRRRDG